MALLLKVKLEDTADIPVRINGGVGVEVTTSNGALTVDLDYADFGVISSIPTSPTSYILTYDTQSNAYVMVPSHLLGGARHCRCTRLMERPMQGKVPVGCTLAVWRRHGLLR